MFWDWGPANSRDLHGVSTPMTWGNGGVKLTIGEEPKYSGGGLGDCPSTNSSTANHPQISLQSKSLSYGYGFYSKRVQRERRPGTGKPEMSCTVPPSLQANILPQTTPLLSQFPSNLPISTFIRLLSDVI